MTWLFVATLTLSASSGLWAGDAITLPVSAKAKSIGSPAPVTDDAAMSPMATRPAEVRSTLPEGQLPQYQLRHRHRAGLPDTQRENGIIHFELSSDESKLNIQATIRINGKPFAEARQKRIASLLKAAEKEKTPEAGDEKDIAPEENDQPGDAESESTASPYSTASDGSETVRRFEKATGEAIDRAGAAWLMTNWLQGPEVLLLKDPFQWYRASQRPVFRVLDRDRSGAVDPDELSDAAELLSQCDSNQDDVVQTIEVDQATKDHVTASQPDERRIRIYSSAPDKQDLWIEVDFQSTSAEKSQISITKVGEHLSESISQIESDDGVVSFVVNGRPLEISAVHGGDSDQVSLGAVIEGYPLLRAADPNGDGRITIRERRSFSDRLKLHDKNQDKVISMDETRPVTRLCFALGPVVHRELIRLRSQSTLPTTTKSNAPEWFTRMDRNRDADLSRSEFPGTDEQFESLDADSDELISAEEAVRFEEQSKDAT